jgi:hypothetical protein
MLPVSSRLLVRSTHATLRSRLRIFAHDSVLSAQLSCIRVPFHSFSTHTYIGRLVLFPLLPLYIQLLLDEQIPSSFLGGTRCNSEGTNGARGAGAGAHGGGDGDTGADSAYHQLWHTVNESPPPCTFLHHQEQFFYEFFICLFASPPRVQVSRCCFARFINSNFPLFFRRLM